MSVLAKPLVKTAADCPTPEKHTPAPSGYLELSTWAEEKGKTHRQIRCPGCGFLTIWVPK